MSKKIIIFVIIAIVVIGAVSYFVLVKKPSTTPSPERIDIPKEEEIIPSEEEIIKKPSLTPSPEGIDIPSKEEIIRVLFPKGGEKLEIGKVYEIRWENYIEDEPLTIGLQVTMPNGKVYFKPIAENVPASASGSYKWTVTSEPADSKYKIEVYPEGNRALVGRSKDFFSIIGDSLIAVNNPRPLEEVASPLKVAGKARRIFSEGEFIVRLVGYYLPNKPVLTETIAHARNCDWLTGDWCDFEVELSFPSEKIKDVLTMIEFYQRDERFGEKLIYKFPVAGEKKPIGKTENLIIDSPVANQTVTSPIIISGKARKIFFEGEFGVDLIAYDYPLGHPKYGESSRVITSTYASIVNDCDWLAGNWCDFRATISYSPENIGVEHMLYFYDGGQEFILALPIKLK